MASRLYGRGPQAKLDSARQPERTPFSSQVGHWQHCAISCCAPCWFQAEAHSPLRCPARLDVVQPRAAARQAAVRAAWQIAVLTDHAALYTHLGVCTQSSPPGQAPQSLPCPRPFWQETRKVWPSWPAYWLSWSSCSISLMTLSASRTAMSLGPSGFAMIQQQDNDA